MSNETRVECPMCGRMIAFIKGTTNMAGEPIMKWHYTADIQAWDWCKASNNSVKVAAMKARVIGKEKTK